MSMFRRKLSKKNQNFLVQFSQALYQYRRRKTPSNDHISCFYKKNLLLFHSIDQRNEAFFNQDWPSRPVESNEVSAPRDPRLFPIMRTPQVPRKTTTTTLNQDQEVSQYFERTSSARMKSR